MLTATSLHKKFGPAVALHSLDLTVAPGEIYALLGPNGAGKTTTINCFLGFLTPDAGSASVAGINVALNPLAARRALAYIPEQVNLYGHFSGLENLAYFSELAGHRYADAQLRAFLTEAGLQAGAHDQRTAAYSKGMRQKVGIAIALAKEAKALLLDEPTSGPTRAWPWAWACAAWPPRPSTCPTACWAIWAMCCAAAGWACRCAWTNCP